VNIQQGVCCYAGRRIYSQLYIAISPYPADRILSAFVVIFIISFSISSSSGLDVIKYQHSSKLWPLYEKALLECDKQIENKLVSYIPQNTLNQREEKMLKESSKKSRKHAPALNVS